MGEIKYPKMSIINNYQQNLKLSLHICLFSELHIKLARVLRQTMYRLPFWCFFYEFHGLPFPEGVQFFRKLRQLYYEVITCTTLSESSYYRYRIGKLLWISFATIVTVFKSILEMQSIANGQWEA